jgi:hypothetical protein
VDDIARLKDRIEELETLLGLQEPQPRTLAGIGPTGWKLMGLLIKRAAVTRGFAFAALYGDYPECDQPANTKTIDQQVCRLNASLRPHGIMIRCERGTGYYLDDQAKAALMALTAGPDRAIDVTDSRDGVAHIAHLEAPHRVPAMYRRPSLGVATDRVAPA